MGRLPEQEQSPQAKREQDLRQSILQVNKMAASYYYYLLRSDAGKTGMAYLQGRGLTEETMHRFGLGFAGGGVIDFNLWFGTGRPQRVP